MRTNSQIAPTQDEEARVALAAEQSGGFLAGAREPLAAQAACVYRKPHPY
jgi:hypothetical protein